MARDAEHWGLDELHGELIRRDGVHAILWEEKPAKRSRYYTIHTIEDCITQCTCRLTNSSTLHAHGKRITFSPARFLAAQNVHTRLFRSLRADNSGQKVQRQSENHKSDLLPAALSAWGTAEVSQPWGEAESERCGFVHPPPQSDRGSYRAEHCLNVLNSFSEFHYNGYLIESSRLTSPDNISIVNILSFLISIITI